MVVVLGPGWPGVLLHEAIGHGLEGDFNRKGTSAFSRRLGEKVASDLCTIVDEGNIRELPERKAVLIPNKYDPDRAHIAVYNGAKATSVAVDVTPFLRPGARFRLLRPNEFYGKPVLEERFAIRLNPP